MTLRRTAACGALVAVLALIAIAAFGLGVRAGRSDRFQLAARIDRANDCLWGAEHGPWPAPRDRTYPTTGYQHLVALLLTEQDCFKINELPSVSSSDVYLETGVKLNPQLPGPLAAEWNHPDPSPRYDRFPMPGVRDPHGVRQSWLSAEERQ